MTRAEPPLPIAWRGFDIDEDRGEGLIMFAVPGTALMKSRWAGVSFPAYGGPNDNLVLINVDNERDKQDETVIHELLHVCFPKWLVTKLTEEHIVRYVAPRLLRALETDSTSACRAVLVVMPSSRAG